jgi:uncharacterized membrane protein
MQLLHITLKSIPLKKLLQGGMIMLMGGYYPFVIMAIWLVIGIAGARM